MTDWTTCNATGQNISYTNLAAGGSTTTRLSTCP
jgi:hypothetical protein